MDSVFKHPDSSDRRHRSLYGLLYVNFSHKQIKQHQQCLDWLLLTVIWADFTAHWSSPTIVDSVLIFPSRDCQESYQVWPQTDQAALATLQLIFLCCHLKVDFTAHQSSPTIVDSTFFVILVFVGSISIAWTDFSWLTFRQILQSIRVVLPLWTRVFFIPVL